MKKRISEMDFPELVVYYVSFQMSQKVDLGYQDTDWVGGNDKEVLDGILP